MHNRRMSYEDTRAARAELARHDERRLALHARILPIMDAPMRARAAAVVDLWERERLCSQVYIDTWRELLAMPAEEAVKRLSDPQARVLRVNSPLMCMELPA